MGKTEKKFYFLSNKQIADFLGYEPVFTKSVYFKTDILRIDASIIPKFEIYTKGNYNSLFTAEPLASGLISKNINLVYDKTPLDQFYTGIFKYFPNKIHLAAHEDNNGMPSASFKAEYRSHIHIMPLIDDRFKDREFSEIVEIISNDLNFLKDKCLRFRDGNQYREIKNQHKNRSRI